MSVYNVTDHIIQLFKRHYPPGSIPKEHSYTVLIDGITEYAETKTQHQRKIIREQSAEINRLNAELAATKLQLNTMTNKYLAIIERMKCRPRGKPFTGK